MFKIKKLSVLAIIGIMLLLNGMALAAGKGGNPSKGTLSSQEISDLQRLRDEEKLARDVYLYFYDIYQKAVFSNISASEQQHMDAVKTLLDRYDIEDPVSGLDNGEFAYDDHQQLYDVLTQEGTPAATEQLLDVLQKALNVGATIEDMDIFDIQVMLSHTDRYDLTNVYENLMKGSRNHLRSYCGLLDALYGVAYEPYLLEQLDLDHLEQWEIDAILATEKEVGPI